MTQAAIYSPTGAPYRHPSGVLGRSRYANLWVIEPGNRVLWYKAMPSPPLSIVADAAGNVIVCYFPAEGGPSITKFDSDGNHQWSVALGGIDYVTGPLSVDASGNIYSVMVDQGIGRDVIKFAANGTELWRAAIFEGATRVSPNSGFYDATLNEFVAGVGPGVSYGTKNTFYRVSPAGAQLGSFGSFASDSGSIGSFGVLGIVGGHEGGNYYTWERKDTGVDVYWLAKWSPPSTSPDWRVPSIIQQSRTLGVSGTYMFVADTSGSPNTVRRYLRSSGIFDGSFDVGTFTSGSVDSIGRVLLGRYAGTAVTRLSATGVADWAWGTNLSTVTTADVGTGRVALSAIYTRSWSFEA